MISDQYELNGLQVPQPRLLGNIEEAQKNDYNLQKEELDFHEFGHAKYAMLMLNKGKDAKQD